MLKNCKLNYLSCCSPQAVNEPLTNCHNLIRNLCIRCFGFVLGAPTMFPLLDCIAYHIRKLKRNRGVEERTARCKGAKRVRRCVCVWVCVCDCEALSRDLFTEWAVSHPIAETFRWLRQLGLCFTSITSEYMSNIPLCIAVVYHRSWDAAVSYKVNHISGLIFLSPNAEICVIEWRGQSRPLDIRLRLCVC